MCKQGHAGDLNNVKISLGLSRTHLFFLYFNTAGVMIENSETMKRHKVKGLSLLV